MAFSKILLHSKTIKNTKNLLVLVELTLAICLTFYKLISFETSIIFLEPKIKLITGVFDLLKKW